MERRLAAMLHPLSGKLSVQQLRSEPAKVVPAFLEAWIVRWLDQYMEEPDKVDKAMHEAKNLVHRRFIESELRLSRQLRPFYQFRSKIQPPQWRLRMFL
jgi:hypothetical protein